MGEGVIEQTANIPDQADEARLQLAQLLVDERRVQQAELVLLGCRESPE